MVYVDVLVVRQVRPRAVQVVLADYRIWWLPRSQIEDGGSYRGGERDFPLGLTEWILAEKLKEEREANKLNLFERVDSDES